MGAEQVQLWTLPFPRNPFFTGREETLSRIHTFLQAQQSVFVSQPVAISGLGGIGKTQTAIEYAYRYAHEYQYVLWVQADTLDTLTKAYVTLAHLLTLPEQDVQDQTVTVEAVKRWLTHQSEWLLILDNADDLALLDAFLPIRPRGHIFFTTRTQLLGIRAARVELEEMSEQEGTRFLLTRIGMLLPGAPLSTVSPTLLALAGRLVNALDGLPLALDQAGAYIEETGCGLPRYLDLYQTHRHTLLSRRSKRPSSHPEPVATTWALSFARVIQANPIAAELLRCCAFLHPEAIPEELLVKSVINFSPQLQQTVGNAVQFDEAISELLTYSLMRRLPDSGDVSIHRLVQAVLHDELDEAVQQRWVAAIVQAVAGLFPFGEFANWNRCQRYLPHAMRCAEYIEQQHLLSLQAAYLLHNVAIYLKGRAQYQEAEPLFKRALAICEKVRGPEHSQTAIILNNLALLYEDQRKDEQAESLLQRALAIYEKVRGPEHPDTAATLDNLAILYKDRGKYEQAESLYQRALAIREQVLGPGHLHTSHSLNNLAVLYSVQRKLEQAEPLYQRALAIKEQVLGPGHPTTINNLENLASIYSIQGKYEQAEPLYQRALTIKEQMLGPEHPDTAQCLYNLAALYSNQRKYEQAELLYQRALAIREQVLGPEHPSTIHSLENYALFLRDVGRDQEAATLEAQIKARKVKADLSQ